MMEIGKYYEVPCAQLRWNDNKQVYYVPVLDHLHADPQFGFPHEHYHIDGRFELHPRLKHWFNIQHGYSLSVISPKLQETYRFEGIISQNLKCLRNETGLLLPNDDGRASLKNYRNWYAGYVGANCKGKRCPHFGTEMLEREGKLVCPMHHITADLQTLVVLPLDVENIQVSG